MIPVLYSIVFEYVGQTYDLYLMQLQKYDIKQKMLILENELKALTMQHKATKIYCDILQSKDKEMYILCSDYTDTLCNMLKDKCVLKKHALPRIKVNHTILYPGTLDDFKYMRINIEIPDKFKTYFDGTYGGGIANFLATHHIVRYSQLKRRPYRNYEWCVEYVYITLKYYVVTK